MSQITRDSLLSLEAYAKARPEFRTQVIAHKKQRTVPVGENVKSDVGERKRTGAVA